MKKVISAFVAVLLLFVCIIPGFAKEEKKLKFREDGTFTILQLTDSQDDQNPSYDMLNLVKRSIEESDPDLIVFTGDIVEDNRLGEFCTDDEPGREGVVVKNIKGEANKEKTLENIKTATKALFDIFEASGVPYVIALGDNDHKCKITNEDWLEIFSEYDNCCVKDESPDADGRIDCNTFIYDKSGTPVFNIWCMDTGLHGVNSDQVEWYKQKSAEITAENGGIVIPAFVFQHIQIDEIGNLFEKCTPFDDGTGLEESMNMYRLNRSIASGNNNYTYAPGKTTEEFEAWVSCGDVLGAFFGHQHIDGFTGKWQGIELGITYGCDFAKGGPYGYRVITLYEDNIAGYDNEQFVYTGSVRKGTDKIEPLVEEIYSEYDNVLIKFFNSIKNFINIFVKSIKVLFA